MYRKEVNAQSPLRILERSIHGGLGAGNLGVVMARAGVGKTAFLIQVGLDDLLRDRDVLHVAIGQSVEHVHAWYDALFDDLARDTRLEGREAVRASVARHRVIRAYNDGSFNARELEKVVGMYQAHVGLKPAAIIIDGYDWDTDPVATRAAEIGAMKALASRLGAELWIAAQTHRERVPKHPTKVPEPCASYESIIDVAIFLEPHGHLVSVRLLKDHDAKAVSETHLELEPDTLQLVTDQTPAETKLPCHAYTLLSGGAQGAESYFGACAESWGLAELNFSFVGRSPERRRGIVELTETELKQGEVSDAYLQSHLHRNFPQTPQFRKMLQTIWHQVATSGQVFVIGVLQEDGTVRGGTGWAAELAKHMHKPVSVFDQERRQWFTHTDGTWAEDSEPRIRRTRFTGTGTRFLSDEAKAAVTALFTRSFGPPAAKRS